MAENWVNWAVGLIADCLVEAIAMKMDVHVADYLDSCG